MFSSRRTLDDKIKIIRSGYSGINVLIYQIFIELKANAVEKIKQRTQQFISDVELV